MIYQYHESELSRRQRAARQRFGLRTIDDVSDEPITLANAYAHLRIWNDSTGSADDAWLTTFGIPAAREYCEGFLGRSLATRTMELSSNRFPAVSIESAIGPVITLPFGPVQSVTSITYQSIALDSNGDQVLDSNDDVVIDTVTVDAADYELDRYVTPNRLVLAYGKAWPSALDAANSVKVRYVTGYVGAPDTPGNDVMPKVARAAMLLMLGHLYSSREAVSANNIAELPLGVQALLERVPNREALGMA